MRAKENLWNLTTLMKTHAHAGAAAYAVLMPYQTMTQTRLVGPAKGPAVSFAKIKNNPAFPAFGKVPAPLAPLRRPERSL
jgi:hypothetical protein